MISLALAVSPFFAPLPTALHPLDLTCTDCDYSPGPFGTQVGPGGSFISWDLAPGANPHGTCTYDAPAGCGATKGCEFTMTLTWSVGTLGSAVRLNVDAFTDTFVPLREYTVDSGFVPVPPSTTGGGSDAVQIPCASFWTSLVTIKFNDPLIPVLKGATAAACSDCILTSE